MTMRAAIMTGGGAAGIAVIRLAGDAPQAVVEQAFTPRGKGDWRKPGRLTLGDIHDGEQAIDEVLVHADHCGVEIHCHGGRRIIQRVLMRLEQLGVEIVGWRDILPEDTIAQEVQRTLPQALTELAVRAILSQHPGGLSRWTAEAINTLTAHEQRIRTQAAALAATFFLSQRLLTPARVVLLGPVNAGKSTLANALGGRRQSITASEPGVTRDWTSQRIDINGLPADLIDTAGYRDTDDALEQQAWRHGREQAAGADLIIVVFDAGQVTPTTIDQFINEHNLQNPLVVINKCDLKKETFPVYMSLNVSAIKQQGLDELRQAIVARLGLEDFDPAKPLVFTQRQQRIITELAQCENEPTMQILLHQLLGDA